MVVEAPTEVQGRRALDAAFARVAELDRALSHYRPESELRRLAATAGSGRAIPVSDDLWNVMTAATELSRATDGAFDITVGPFVALWNRSSRQGELPRIERIASARSRVGYQHVAFNETPSRSVELLRDGMQLDLGGIAKGYALDCALRVLADHGVTRALVDGGGDVAVGDPPSGRRGWAIAVATLGEFAVIEVSNVAVATSGDLYQYVEIDGVRYSHVIDPRTGLGCTDRSTVTVVAATGMHADGLASAVSVLGLVRGGEFIDTQNQGAGCVRSGDGTYRSEDFPVVTDRRE